VTVTLAGIGTFGANGSVDIPQPQSTTTYTLTATAGCGGQATAQMTITATACPAPTINSFTATPSAVTIGSNQTVRLAWSVFDNSGTGTSVTLQGIGTFPANGFTDIPQPQSTTTYNLTATAACGATSTAQTTVTATSCLAPGVSAFSASPSVVTIGGSQTVRLSWSTTDPSGTGVTVSIAGIGTFPGTSGFVDIAQPQATTTYSLTATSGCGASSSAQTTVVASPPSATTVHIDLPFWSPNQGAIFQNPNANSVVRFPGDYTISASAGSPASATIQFGAYSPAIIGNTCYGVQTFIGDDGPPWLVQFLASDTTVLDSFTFDRPGYSGGTITWTGTFVLPQAATLVRISTTYYSNRYVVDRTTNECTLEIDHWHGGPYQGYLDISSGVYTNGPTLPQTY
jgi:hypothetical protein